MQRASPGACDAALWFDVQFFCVVWPQPISDVVFQLVLLGPTFSSFLFRQRSLVDTDMLLCDHNLVTMTLHSCCSSASCDKIGRYNLQRCGRLLLHHESSIRILPTTKLVTPVLPTLRMFRGRAWSISSQLLVLHGACTKDSGFSYG